MPAELFGRVTCDGCGKTDSFTAKAQPIASFRLNYNPFRRFQTPPFVVMPLHLNKFVRSLMDEDKTPRYCWPSGILLFNWIHSASTTDGTVENWWSNELNDPRSRRYVHTDWDAKYSIGIDIELREAQIVYGDNPERTTVKFDDIEDRDAKDALELLGMTQETNRFAVSKLAAQLILRSVGRDDLADRVI